MLELVLGSLLSKALPGQPRGRLPEASCSPLRVFQGLTFTGLPKMALAELLLLLSMHPTWPPYHAKALLFPLLPWFPRQSQAARGTEA